MGIRPPERPTGSAARAGESGRALRRPCPPLLPVVLGRRSAVAASPANAARRSRSGARCLRGDALPRTLKPAPVLRFRTIAMPQLGAGVEPATRRLEVDCSTQLSYPWGRIWESNPQPRSSGPCSTAELIRPTSAAPAPRYTPGRCFGPSAPGRTHEPRPLRIRVHDEFRVLAASAARSSGMWPLKAPSPLAGECRGRELLPLPLRERAGVRGDCTPCVPLWVICRIRTGTPGFTARCAAVTPRSPLKWLSRQASNLHASR